MNRLFMLQCLRSYLNPSLCDPGLWKGYLVIWLFPEKQVYLSLCNENVKPGPAHKFEKESGLCVSVSVFRMKTIVFPHCGPNETYDMKADDSVYLIYPISTLFTLTYLSATCKRSPEIFPLIRHISKLFAVFFLFLAAVHITHSCCKISWRWRNDGLGD